MILVPSHLDKFVCDVARELKKELPYPLLSYTQIHTFKQSQLISGSLPFTLGGPPKFMNGHHGPLNHRTNLKKMPFLVITSLLGPPWPP